MVKDKICNIIILRDCKFKNRVAVRIIDYIGSNYYFKYLDKLFKTILKRKKVDIQTNTIATDINDEYVLVSIGVEGNSNGFGLNKIGVEIDENQHIKPFEQKNNKIIYGFLVDKLYKKKIRLFKGDSDMDRPNL